MNAAYLFKPLFARGQLRCIGATTPEEYKKYVEKDAAFERRFQQVYVAEPSVADTINIFRGLKKTYEGHHRVRILDRALIVAAKLSARCITEGRHLPDKAIDLVDEACATVKVQLSRQPKEIANMARRNFQLEVEMDALEKKKDKANKSRFADVRKDLEDLRDKLVPLVMGDREEKERIGEIRRMVQKREEMLLTLQAAEHIKDFGCDAFVQYAVLQENDTVIAQLEGETAGNLMLLGIVGPDQITEVVGRQTGIPVIRLGQNKKERLIGLAERLHKRVVGQDQAVDAVAEVV